MAGPRNQKERTVEQAWVLTPDRQGEVVPEPVRVWGLTASERLERALVRAGVGRVQVFPPQQPLPTATKGGCLLLRSDYFYDERLVKGLVQGPDRILLEAVPGASTAAPDAQAVAIRVEDGTDRPTLEAAAECLRGRSTDPGAALLDPLPRVVPSQVAPAYNAALRKLDPPFLYRSLPDRVRETENRIFASSYKGITDLVTKWVFPIPARAVTRALVRRGVRPNTVTAASYFFTGLAAWLFYEGHFGLGLLSAWLMTFLDTVDGKLARVILTSSPVGSVLDHGLDLVHPPFWWAAWAYGLAPEGAGLGSFAPAMWIIVGGYVFGRLLEGVFLLAFHQEIFCWRPFDAYFRTIIARRNPNLLILSAATLAGMPGEGYWALAAWTLLCLGVHIVRLAQAFAVQQHGIPIQPWHQETAAGKDFPGPTA